ncbi:Hypothetical protein SMAX5B_012507 [Scophthalmus maximus]|uniref:Uncharacterized protein n=1 Tax=Scophthalmus maximus TaxID=52904 RepID=A0A2U9B7M2_SCOMX|nr:Hypothetical protein SMAX5B_012507 [Scophthalmus maximus]
MTIKVLSLRFLSKALHFCSKPFRRLVWHLRIKQIPKAVSELYLGTRKSGLPFGISTPELEIANGIPRDVGKKITSPTSGGPGSEFRGKLERSISQQLTVSGKGFGAIVALSEDLERGLEPQCLFGDFVQHVHDDKSNTERL